MSTMNPKISNPGPIKLEIDQFQSVTVERVKNMKMAAELGNLARERDLLKKEVDVLEKTQRYLEFEKCSLEEKLGRSERRCEELEKKVEKARLKTLNLKEKLDRSRTKCEELRRKEIETAEAADESRLKKMEFGEASELDQSGRNLAYSGTQDDGAFAYILNVAESKGFKRPGLRGFCCRSNLKIIDAIKSNLHKENLENFEQSCFGDLLKINRLKFHGQLMMQLLLHLDMSASNKEKLVFKINSSDMEFGPSEFFRITGLGFGKSEATKDRASSSIHMDVFQDRPNITLEDVKKAFLNQKGRSELKLKLALLYFLHGILLVKHNGVKIDVQYLHLIEDLQKFNAFPWGRVAYQSLVSSILQVRARMHSSEAVQSDLYGFCYALQVWAYEVMPSLAAHCAYQANNSENLTPCILRWSTKFKRDNLKNFFSMGDKAHTKNTMGKMEELSTDTIPEAALPLRRGKRKLRSDNDDQKPHVQPSSTATSTNPLHVLARIISRAECLLESLQRRIDEPFLDISRSGFHRLYDEEDNASGAPRVAPPILIPSP